MILVFFLIVYVDCDCCMFCDGIIEYFGVDEVERLFKKYKWYVQINVWCGVDEVIKKWFFIFINYVQVFNWDYDSYMVIVMFINDFCVVICG